nr:putative nuclease harbi1 [Quercus suber]
MSGPNDEFWTYDFNNAYFSNDYKMQCEDNNFNDDYLNPDEEMFNGSYDFDNPFFNQDADMHGCCNDTRHGCLNPDHDILHNNGEEEEFDYINGLVGEMASYVQRPYNKCPMCTSILTCSGYMEEVRDGNPKQCFEIFRMSLQLFYHFVDELKQHGYLKEGNGRVDVQESVVMFLYIIGHNTRMRCVADRFQHSTKTVARKFQRVLRVVHSYGQHLIKPDPNVTGLPRHLPVNKYHPWFERCISAIDGIHVSARPLTSKTQQYISRKSTVTTNVMCTYDHGMRFMYIHSSWEGSVNDSRVLEEAIKDPKHGFPWPPKGSYYLVDLGYPIGTSFLPPHKSTRYHAQEFRSSNRQSATKKELYNYRHCSLHMVIKRCFGVLKARFPI